MGDDLKQDVHDLFVELTSYENRGVNISLNGWPASPMQVAQACFLKEDSAYMRDYQLDDKGDLENLGFHRVELWENKE